MYILTNDFYRSDFGRCATRSVCMYIYIRLCIHICMYIYVYILYGLDHRARLTWNALLATIIFYGRVQIVKVRVSHRFVRR